MYPRSRSFCGLHVGVYSECVVARVGKLAAAFVVARMRTYGRVGERCTAQKPEEIFCTPLRVQWGQG